MLLAVNIGNSHIRIGVHDQERWRANWTLKTTPHRSADEYRVLLTSLLELDGFPPRAVDAAIIASVVPGLSGLLSTAIRELFGISPRLVNVTMKSNLRIAIARAGELGTDLFVNAVAAYHRYRGACVVVDFGTALSFTAVSADGEIRGVSIAPGLQAALEALVSTTAQLPFVELTPPPSAIGTDTITAIQSGIVYGYAGMTEGILKRMKAELGEPVACTATGGFAQLVAPLCPDITDIDPLHTLKGLKLLHEMQNRE